MKKILAILLAFALAFGFAGCGSELNVGDEISSLRLDVFKVDSDGAYFLGRGDNDSEWYFDVAMPDDQIAQPDIKVAEISGIITEIDKDLNCYTIQLDDINNLNIIETKSKSELEAEKKHDEAFMARMDADSKLKSRIDRSVSGSEYEELVNSVSISTDYDAVFITIDLDGENEITKGQMSGLRNVLCDVPIQYAEENGYKYKTVEVNVTVSTARADSYIFTVGSGWDKDVE